MQYQPKSFLWCVRVASAAVAVVACQPALATPECPALLRHTFARLQDEKPQNLCEHAGKVVLVVNTASYCGFTGQYKGLEALYGRYRDQGLVVLGFPSNDFGQQEPGNAKAIADFCENTFGVKFPMLTKTVVSGRGANAFYKQLGQKTGEVPTWNFHKYLIDRSGQGVRSFPSAQDPASPAFVQAVEKLLTQK